MLELESELPNLADGNQDAWHEYLQREMDINPRWVWNVDLEGMLVQAKEKFHSLKEEEENAVAF